MFKTATALLFCFCFLFSAAITRAQGFATLDSTNLPIILLYSNGNTINDQNKVTGNMKIISNTNGKKNRITDPANVYDGKIGIEVRGATSASYPQKPFSIETRDDLGNDRKVSLLGMPKESDWILLSNYNDKVFMRNSLSFKLFNEMGHYASRTRLCEVLLDGNYRGVYVFTEKIKRDSGRVDIAKLDANDNFGDSLTGGYIFKIDTHGSSDYWTSQFRPRANTNVEFVYHYPKADEITKEQRAYIRIFVNEFETALNGNSFADPLQGYKSYIDVNSFIDYFILQEVSRNVDGYKKSSYFNKDKQSKSGGLLHAGPVWDFDWAWKDIWDCDEFAREDGSGWAYRIQKCNKWPVPPAWMDRLLLHYEFADKLIKRYQQLRTTILSDNYLYHQIDSMSTLVNEAKDRHYKVYSITASDAPEMAPQPTTYEGQVIKFKGWITERLAWLDNNLTLANITDNIIEDTPEIIDPNNAKIYKIFPNPVKDVLFIKSYDDIASVEIHNLTGTLFDAALPVDPKYIQINVSGFTSGYYFVTIRFVNGKVATDKVVVR